MSEPESAIIVDHLSKSFKLPHEQSSGLKQEIVNFLNRKHGYEVQQVLKDVSFEVKKGDFFGIVGRNGSGKSTLLKLLAGIYAPDDGGVSVNGTLTPFIELGVGFNMELTGRENVFLNGALLGFSRKQMEDMYEDIVAFAELERFMDQKLKNYSSGMQVRLAFSIAIRADTDILILDEVLAVGDAAFQQKCFDYFEKLKNDKKTIVFVTHDMSSVKRFCNKAILVENGALKLVGSPDRVAEQYSIDNITDPVDDDKSGDTGDIVRVKKSAVKGLNLVSLSNKKLSRYEKLKIKASFSLTKPQDVYIGLSISLNGASVAEINSKNVNFTQTIDKVQEALIDIDLNYFNPGTYAVSVAIFRRNNRALLDSRLNCFEFLITGSDDKRGGAILIDSEWRTV